MDVVDITRNIKVDTATKRGSVINVIRLLNPDLSSGHAGEMLTRLLRDHPELVAGCDRIKINGRGHVTPVASASTLIEIIWLLPGRAAREFRRTSAQTVCRALGGDLTIAAEIEARHQQMQGTPQGQATQDFLLANTTSNNNSVVEAASNAGLPAELQLATQEQKEAFVDNWLRYKRLEDADRIREKRVKLLHSTHELMEALGGLDDRDRIEFKDRARCILTTDFEESGAGSGGSSTAIVVADPGPSVATPDCVPSVRGVETSIHVVASQLGMRVGESAGKIGKVIKAKYAAKYGAEAAQSIPKRSTMFRGKPFMENTYFERDKDIIGEAIREVLAPQT